MDTRIIATDKAYLPDIDQARRFLLIFGLKWTVETRFVDISKESLYETKDSSTKKKVKSLRTDWMVSLGTERCVALVCDKKKSLQIGLNGQQGTFNNRYGLEVYVDSRKNKDGMTGTAWTLAHEVLHALAEYHRVEDTLHKDLEAGKTLIQCREILLDRILNPQSKYGLLPVVQAKLILLSEQAWIQHGYRIVIDGGYRSPEEQDRKFRQVPKVTNAKAWESMHQYRIAFDYYFDGKTQSEKWPPSQSQKWNTVNVLARSLGFYSYGIEENFDDGHLQLMFGRTEKQIRNGDADWSKYWSVRPVFDRDMELGVENDDVLLLQKFLNQNGFTVSESGNGSPGNETRYFGERTLQAVQKFQVRYNVVSPGDGGYGRVGPRTRAVLNQL